MEKGEILKGLNEVQHELSGTVKKLNNLLSQPIWSPDVYSEMDETIETARNIKEDIDKLMEMQKSIILKPKS